MEFQVVLSSAKIKLGNVDYEGIRSTTNLITVEHLSLQNPKCIVQNGISGKLSNLFHMKSLDIANFGFLGHTESEPCLLDMSLQDRHLAIQNEAHVVDSTGCLRLSDATVTGLLGLVVYAAGTTDNVKMRLSFQLLKDNRKILELNSPNLQIKKRTRYSYVEAKFNYPNALTRDAWKSPKFDFTGNLKIFVRFNEEALNNIFKSGRVAQRSFNLLQGLLFGDVFIEAGHQLKLRCHKDILTSSTNYFKAMFESGMQEEMTGIIHMPEMSEVAVRAFLAYLYQNDILMPLNCCSTALELLVAADKYGMPLLYDIMADILLHSKNDWCSVETALELYFFAKLKKVEGHEQKTMEDELLESALDILLSKGKDVLNTCPAFQEAFVVEGQPGIQLCIDLLIMRKGAVDENSDSETENDKNNDSTGNGSNDGKVGNSSVEDNMPSAY